MDDPGTKVKKSLQDNPGVRECCKRDGTLKRIELPNGARIFACMVCGANHHYMPVDAGRIGVKC